MFEQDDTGQRCRACIIRLNLLQGWGLTDQQIGTYVAQIIEQVPLDILATDLETVVGYFHADHEIVATLRDPHDPDHESAWDWVEHEITRVISYKNLGWSNDRAVEIADLIQVVHDEVYRSIGNYHYRSLLRTWLQSVTILRLRRYHRDSGAAKRSAQLEPLEAALEQSSSIEPTIMASLLEAEIQRKLLAHGGERYAQIFSLRIIDGLSAQEIGKQVSLHPSRVRTLLRQAQEQLQNDSDLQRWNNEQG